MVLSERGGNVSIGSGSSGLRRGGPVANLRSHSPSNGQQSDSSSDSEESQEANVMRIGGDYQAVVPDKSTVRPKPAPDSIPDHAVLVWKPTSTLNDVKRKRSILPDNKLDEMCDLSEFAVEEYCNLAKEKYNYNMEQALGMLCWHKFKLDVAMADLPNFTPFPDEWTVEDKVLFEQAFQFHDKHFHKIKQMLPDKPIASLVKYYYSWKKTRSRTSLMDRQARRLKEDAAKEEASDEDSGAGSDSELPMVVDGNGDSKENGAGIANGLNETDPTIKQRCENCCTTATGQFHSTGKGVLCRTCFTYWKRTGQMKSGTLKRHEPTRLTPTLLKTKRKPPRGIHVQREDLELLAKEPNVGEVLLKNLDFDIVNLKRQVQNNKQMISCNKSKLASGIKNIRLPDTQTRLNSRWTREEELIAVQAIRKYGKDFVAVAEVLGNKNEAHIKTFYVNNEKRYKLNDFVAEWEAQITGDDAADGPTSEKRARVN